MSTRTIVGQCPITSAPLSISDDGQNEYRDLTGLRVLLQGLPIGGQPTSVQWTHNGYKILESINEFRSHWYVGNVELHTSGPCKDRRYRVYLKVRGKLYGGIYQYSVTNEYTKMPVFSPKFNITDTDPPTDLTVRQIENDVVEATWNAPPNPVEDYRVFVNTDKVNGDGIVVTSTSYRIKSYKRNAITIRVRATSEHFWSETLGPKTIHPVHILEPEITVSSVGATSAQLIFIQPGGSISADKYYTILIRYTCPAYNRHQSYNMTSITLGSLEEGATYLIKVIAHNYNTGFTSPNNSAMLTTDSAVPDGSPSKLRISEIHSTHLRLTWSKIRCLNQNGNITNYIIQYQQRNVNKTLVTSNSDTTVMVSGLLPFTYYIFTVRGQNSKGIGPPSIPSEPIRTAEDRPTAVRRLSAVVTLTTIQLSWLTPAQSNGPITKYTIGYDNKKEITTSSTNYKITGLRPGSVIYNLTVTPSTNAGIGSSVLLPHVRTHTLSKLQNVEARALSQDAVHVSWDLHDHNTEITNYQVYYKNTGLRTTGKNNRPKANESTATVRATENYTVFRNLTHSRTYSFEVAPVIKLNGLLYKGPKSKSNPVVLFGQSCALIVYTGVTESMVVISSLFYYFVMFVP